jgi:proteasome lid subunit RPN8/RPN11
MRDNLITITKGVRDAIEGHAWRAHPSECCGLLSGNDGLITQFHPLRNTAERPEKRYFAAPEDLFSAMRVIRDQGNALMGIYHSHPRTPAYPSLSDVEMAFYSDALYFIMSLEPSVDLRAYRITDSRVENVNVSVLSHAQ